MKKILIGFLACSSILLCIGIQEVSAKEFSDVSSTRWSYTAIQEISDKGLINGFSDGSFQPTKTITNAEAAVIINNYMKREGKLTTDYESEGLFDVSENMWYTQAVYNMHYLDIFENKEYKEFFIDAEVTRMEMVSIINNVEGYKLKADYKFCDVPDIIADDIKIAYSNGIISGIKTANGTVIFEPWKTVTREEFVTILNNVYHYNPNFVADEIPTVKNTLEQSRKIILDLLNQHMKEINHSPLVMDKNLNNVAQSILQDTNKVDFEGLLRKNKQDLSGKYNGDYYYAGRYGIEEQVYSKLQNWFGDGMYDSYSKVGIGWIDKEDNNEENMISLVFFK